MSNFAIWKRMMRYLLPYWRWAIVALVGVIGSTALMVAIPAVLRDVIDIGIERGDGDYMLAAGALVVGLGVLRGITGFLFRYFGEKLSHYVAYDIRNETYDRVQNLAFTYHDNARVGTIITRAISDVNEIQRFFAFGLIDGLTTALLFIGVSIIMFITSPLLAFIALTPMIPLAFMSKNFAMAIDPMWKGIMDRLQKLGNHIQENAIGAEVVRAFAREKYEFDKFSVDNEMLYHEQLSLVKRWGSYLPMSSFVVTFCTAAVLFFGGLMEQNEFGGVTVGVIVAFNAYILLLSAPMRFMGFVILLTTQAISSAGRVFEILDTPIDIDNKPEPVRPVDIQGRVRLEDVQFTYEGTAEPVLHDISLEANPGEVVAVVGPTGSGKSTLANLIPRFYDVSDGRVLIDDVDVRDLELATLRRSIGIVMQSSLLFSATIRENIAYGRPDATDEDVIAAAKAANAHDFVMEFPDGYDTLIGERGVTLSGGQRQRVAIARALLINPRILVLDDATSSVDTRTEFAIQQAMKRLMVGRTTFIVAQRLNSVKDADQILVLDKGRIVERGAHDALLELDGHYAAIYRLQLEDQERVRDELRAAGLLRRPKFDKRSTEEFAAVIDQAGGKD